MEQPAALLPSPKRQCVVEPPPPAVKLEPKTEEPAAAVPSNQSPLGVCPVAKAEGPSDSPPLEEPPPRPPLVPRSSHTFVPKCHHRHALKRTAGSPDGEPLECDGACGLIIPPTAPRWSCYPCDFDMCELCMLSLHGGAAYLELLTSEEARGKQAAADAARALAAATERAKAAEAKLVALKPQAKGPAADARALEQRKALEAKLSAAEERACAATEEVARLEKEVVERRQRSKANLEKMYNAQKERDEARAQVGAADAAQAAALAEQTRAAEDASRQLAAARQQLACCFGDPEALGALASLEELEQIESLCLAGLGRLAQRRMELHAAEEAARAARRACVTEGCRAERAVAFAPCGHVALCKSCGMGRRECPLCHAEVERRVLMHLP